MCRMLSVSVVPHPWSRPGQHLLARLVFFQYQSEPWRRLVNLNSNESASSTSRPSDEVYNLNALNKPNDLRMFV